MQFGSAIFISFVSTDFPFKFYKNDDFQAVLFTVGGLTPCISC